MSKNNIFIFLIVGIFCNACNGSISGPLLTSKLADIILESTSSRALDPEHNAKCFAVYLPQITDCTDRYEKCYDNSVSIANDAEKALKAEVQDDLDTIDYFADEICGGFQNCTTLTATLYDTFECYFAAAGETIQSASSVQKIAKDRMRYVENKLQNINYDLETRNDKCSSEYTDEINILYGKLEACLGGAPIEIPTTTTTEDPPLPPTIKA